MDRIGGSQHHLEDSLNTFRIDRHGIVLRLGHCVRSQVTLTIWNGQGVIRRPNSRLEPNHTDFDFVGRLNKGSH
jgi:hypothetical protein